MIAVILALGSGVPPALTEIRRLGRTRRRPVDVPAHFDRPGSSNGPTEAANGHLEHLRRSALGYRNLTNYFLLRPTTARDRRIQARTAPSILKSLKHCRRGRRVPVWPRQTASRNSNQIGESG